MKILLSFVGEQAQTIANRVEAPYLMEMPAVPSVGDSLSVIHGDVMADGDDDEIVQGWVRSVSWYVPVSRTVHGCIPYVVVGPPRGIAVPEGVPT